MQITVDLPPDVHRRVLQLADARQQALSATLADLVARGLAEHDEPRGRMSIDPVTGFPVMSLGRPVTSAEVAEMLDDE